MFGIGTQELLIIFLIILLLFGASRIPEIAKAMEDLSQRLVPVLVEEHWPKWPPEDKDDVSVKD